MHNSDLITPQHLTRKAVIYIRQSTPHQVVSHQESLRLQYALGERARQLGWSNEAIDIIDEDLGLTAASAAHRTGFNTLVAQVTLEQADFSVVLFRSDFVLFSEKNHVKALQYQRVWTMP